jgi:predicted phage tail protein
MEREVRLYGPLAKFIGQRRFLAEVSSAGEAIRMLLANFPGLERHMADHQYSVVVDGYDTTESEIHYPASQSIKIVPVIGGAGGGVGKIIAGAALVALAIALPGAGMFAGGSALFGATGAAAGGLVALAGNVGLALMFGGVAQLLSPTPQLAQIGPASTTLGGAAGRNTTTEGTELDPQASYSFSGIQNTSRMASPVPLVFGETIVGSVVISAGIDVDTI